MLRALPPAPFLSPGPPGPWQFLWGGGLCRWWQDTSILMVHPHPTTTHVCPPSISADSALRLPPIRSPRTFPDRRHRSAPRNRFRGIGRSKPPLHNWKTEGEWRKSPPFRRRPDPEATEPPLPPPRRAVFYDTLGAQASKASPPPPAWNSQWIAGGWWDGLGCGKGQGHTGPPPQTRTGTPGNSKYKRGSLLPTPPLQNNCSSPRGGGLGA